MTITIREAVQTPTWTTLDLLIQEALGVEGHLTRIARYDNGSNYRGLGAYALTYTPTDKKHDEYRMSLLVTG